MTNFGKKVEFVTRTRSNCIFKEGIYLPILSPKIGLP